MWSVQVKFSLVFFSVFKLSFFYTATTATQTCYSHRWMKSLRSVNLTTDTFWCSNLEGSSESSGLPSLPFSRRQKQLLCWSVLVQDVKFQLQWHLADEEVKLKILSLPWGRTSTKEIGHHWKIKFGDEKCWTKMSHLNQIKFLSFFSRFDLVLTCVWFLAHLQDKSTFQNELHFIFKWMGRFLFKMLLPSENLCSKPAQSSQTWWVTFWATFCCETSKLYQTSGLVRKVLRPETESFCRRLYLR